MYIDYMEKTRFSEHYSQLLKNIFRIMAAERRDIMNSPLRRRYVAFRIAVLATLIGEEPDYYWGRDYPGSTLKQRSASITGARLNFGNHIFNDPEKIVYLKDKVAFAETFHAFFNRRYCCPHNVSETEFCNLFRSVKRLVVKPMRGMGGRGVQVIDVDDNLEHIYQNLFRQKDPSIVEEYIAQTGLLHELNPSSLNTIRVITIRFGEKIIPASAYLRLGGPESVTDNLHSGGVKILIHMPDGKLLDGMTMSRNHLTRHPATGVSFTGLTIPRWDEILAFCIRAHEAAPEGLDRIGWDVCVDDAHLLMIEGNDCPGFGAYRKGNPNCWRLFKQYFNEKERAALF